MVALFSKRVLKYTECVVAPTAKVRSLLVDYGVKQRIAVVPTGIELERIAKLLSNSEKQRIREKLRIPHTNKVLISVGRLAKEKNLEEIIRFVSRLNNKNLTLVVVGDGPHRENLESYASKLEMSDKVIFVGMVSPKEISSYYQLGDVFVSASNSETQGLTYVEALANGLPAICRKDPCLEDVIEDGRNGWQYTTFELFREKISLILNQENVYKRVSESARLGVVRKYSSAAFAKNIEQIYLDTVYDKPIRENRPVMAEID